MIFNNYIENVEQKKLKNQKQNIFIYTVYSYRMKKILHLNSCCHFLPQKSKTLYSGHLVIADTFLGTAAIRYRKV